MVAAGNVSMPQQQQNNTFVVNAQQRPQLGPAVGHIPPRQPTPPPVLSEDDKKFLNKPVSLLLALLGLPSSPFPLNLHGFTQACKSAFKLAVQSQIAFMS